AFQCRPNNPGLAVSVVKDGKILFAKGYGVSDNISKKPVTNNTLFQIASLTKAFTSTLLTKQLDQYSNLSVTSNVADIIGNGFKFSTSIRTVNANIRDLMAHTLAIPSNNGMRLDNKLTRDNLPSRLRTLKSIHAFRTSFIYSNLNYGLLTHISEKLGHDKWENLMQQEIFNPLGMSTTSFVTRDNSGRDVATGYDDGPSGLLVPVSVEFSRQYASAVSGSGCIMSSAVDMTKWMNFHLNGGKNEHGVQVVNKSSVESTHIARNHIVSSTVEKYFSQPKVPVSTSENNYAAGWKTGHYRGYRILRHTGSTYGYVSLITLFPDMNIGIFMSMTGSDQHYLFRALIHNFLSDVVLGVHPWLNESTICSFPKPWYDSIHISNYYVISKSHKASRPLTEYVGSYTNDAYGTLDVTYNTSSSQLELKYGIGQWTLYPRLTHDQFSGEAQGLLQTVYDLHTIKFLSSKTSRVSAINAVEVTSFETSSPPVFTRSSNFGPPNVVG
ncbi:hypothetical protein FSP39_007591, partial [Pinctada imbricata]